MSRVVFDTNLYISALVYSGRPLDLFQEAVEGRVHAVVSEEILREVEDVLRRKFNLPEDRISRVVELIRGCAEVVHPMERVSIITEDDDDNRVLECARTGSAEFIVSGDRHLLRLGSFAEIRILRITEFLNLLRIT